MCFFFRFLFNFQKRKKLNEKFVNRNSNDDESCEECYWIPELIHIKGVGMRQFSCAKDVEEDDRKVSILKNLVKRNFWFWLESFSKPR